MSSMLYNPKKIGTMPIGDPCLMTTSPVVVLFT